MLRKYKTPRQLAVNENGQRELIVFDASRARKAKFRIKVDVGPSSYWSEIATVSTLDNLLMLGKIDLVQYLKRIPNDRNTRHGGAYRGG